MADYSPRTNPYTWITTKDALVDRGTDTSPSSTQPVIREPSGNVDFLTFKRISEGSFAGIGL
jgi:hypothetical protein